MNSKLQEQKWQAESDAETMARYQEILSDKARMNRAVKAAKEKATDLSKRANAMKSAASTTYRNGGKMSKGVSRRRK
jgi:hypothetical protein